MSIATRLGDSSGRGHMGEQAEAGGARIAASIAAAGAMQSCHPSCEKCPHPWGPARPRPSVHPKWLRGCCAPTPPVDVTSAWEGPVATHGRLPRPSPRSASFAEDGFVACVDEALATAFFVRRPSTKPCARGL